MVESQGLTREKTLFYSVAALIWIAAIFFSTQGHDTDVSWVARWRQWDAEWYYQIWKDGWGFDPHTLVFMPLFPWLAGALADLTSLSFEAASLLINLPSYLLAGVLAAEYLQRRFQVPWWGVFLFHLTAPAGFYAFVPYSDAVFCLLFWLAVVLCEIPAEPPRWRAELGKSLFLAALPFSRLTAFALAVWLMFKRWSAFSLVLVFAGFCVLNWKYTGDPLFFLNTQIEFNMPSGWFVDGIVVTMREALQPPPTTDLKWLWLQASILPLFSSLLIVLSALWLFRQKNWFWLATLLAVAFFSRNQSYWRSVVRYDLPLVPLLALPWLRWFQRSAARPVVRRIFIAGMVLFLAGSFALQLAIASRLHQGLWAF